MQNTGSRLLIVIQNTKHNRDWFAEVQGLFCKTRGLVCSDLPADGEAASLDASALRQPRSRCRRALAIASVNFLHAWCETRAPSCLALCSRLQLEPPPPLRWCASISRSYSYGGMSGARPCTGWAPAKAVFAKFLYAGDRFAFFIANGSGPLQPEICSGPSFSSLPACAENRSMQSAHRVLHSSIYITIFIQFFPPKNACIGCRRLYNVHTFEPELVLLEPRSTEVLHIGGWLDAYTVKFLVSLETSCFLLVEKHCEVRTCCLFFFIGKKIIPDST